jgi:nucleotide-binding universal stress UspA family protein
VDGSDSSGRALTWAIEQAVIEHRPLTLVHTVNPVTPAYLDAATAHPEEARQALRDGGAAVLAAARARVAKVAPDLEVHDVLGFDDARQVLIELSRTAALLVLGSRGRGTLPRMLLGSVGVALVRHAHCPVVIHRPGPSGVARHGVVVGADGSEESLPVLEYAYREASLRQLPLTVLHCFWDINAATAATYVVAEPVIDLESEKMFLAQSMAGMAEKYPDVAVHTDMATGLPQEALVRVGERMDLIVVGAHQSGLVSLMLFGSVSVAVVEHATSPVAVVPLAPVD